MSRYGLILLLLAAGILPASAEAQFSYQEPEAASSFIGEATADFSSEYIWRGLEYNSEFVFLPSLRLNERGLEIAAFGVLDLTDSNGLENDFTQWIFRGGLARGDAGGSIGLFYNYYYYPEHNRSKTQEVSLEMEWGRPIFMAIDIYWDFDRAHGFYGRAGIGGKIDLDPLLIEPRCSVGAASSNYLETYYAVDKDSFCDLVSSIKAELRIVAGLRLTVKVSYYQLMTSALRQATMAEREGDYWWYQLGAAWRF